MSALLGLYKEFEKGVYRLTAVWRHWHIGLRRVGSGPAHVNERFAGSRIWSDWGMFSRHAVRAACMVLAGSVLLLLLLLLVNLVLLLGHRR